MPAVRFIRSGRQRRTLPRALWSAGSVALFLGLLACTTLNETSDKRQPTLMSPSDDATVDTAVMPAPTETPFAVAQVSENIDPPQVKVKGPENNSGEVVNSDSASDAASEDEDSSYDDRFPPQQGKASWYQIHRRTANGERYSSTGMQAAHKTLPFDSMVEVKCLKTGKVVQVRINDRGPYVRGCIIDLNREAAQKLGILKRGVTPVEIRVLESPPK